MKDINRQIFIYPQSFFLRYAPAIENHRFYDLKQHKASLTLLDFSSLLEENFSQKNFHVTNPSSYVSKIKAINKKIRSKEKTQEKLTIAPKKIPEPRYKLKKIIFKTSSKNNLKDPGKIQAVPIENLPHQIIRGSNDKAIKKKFCVYN
jgi:hypothetical protein